MSEIHRKIAEIEVKIEHLESLREDLGDEITDRKKQALAAELRQLTESATSPPVSGAATAAEVSAAGRGLAVGGDVSGSTLVTGDAVILNVAKRWIQALEPRAGAADLEKATAKYLRYILHHHRYLKLKGMGVHPKVPLRLPLLDLFVPLRARLGLPEGETWRRELHRAGREITRIEGLGETWDILELLHQHNGLILLGDPGAGKTTVLKFLALKLALGEGRELGLGDRLPFLVPLSGYANALAKTGVRLDTFIADHFHQLGADLPMREIQARALKAGKALVLLDGLDEVKDLGLRHEVVERVEHFYSFHRQLENGGSEDAATGAGEGVMVRPAGNRFLLTSRIVGYREVRPTVQGLAECTLIDFGKPEIEEFVGKWTLAVERQAWGTGRLAESEAEEERQALLTAIHDIEGVGRLAANPLLLTILALMKRQDVVLPARRVELFDRYINTLLSSWNRARGLGRPASLELDVLRTQRILAPLALWMHQVSPGVGLVKRSELTRWLEVWFAERGAEDPEAEARRLLADVRQETSLLLERGAGEYGFIHLSFEEYLAAMAIAFRGPQEVGPIVEVLAAHAGDSAWREVSLLSVGYLGIIQQRPEAAGAVVESLADHPASAPRETAILAGEAVLDAGPGGVPEASRRRVVEVLVAAMQGAAEPPVVRRKAGLLLGRLGWLPEDLDAWVEIPPGRFRYGEQREPRRFEQRFWIGRYPVTVAQFQRFLDDGGYRRQKVWSREGWAWRQRHDQLTPALWNNREFHNPLSPVVVSWYEAEAYCSWTERQWRAGASPGADTIPAAAEGYRVRLPSEEEWERAARGTEGREYPSGDRFEIHRFNTLESDTKGRGIGTTAVCTYPQGVSPDGVWDLGGNVWEWTRSSYTAPSVYYLTKGGSYYSIDQFSRCAFRYGDAPEGGREVTGFRLAVVPEAGLD